MTTKRTPPDPYVPDENEWYPHLEWGRTENGSGRSIKIDLVMAQRFPLGQELRNQVAELVENFSKELNLILTVNDPKNIQWKAQWVEKVHEIPNEYCGPKCCPHSVWFLVSTKIGTIKIGWRKKVINIEWDQTALTKTAQELFPQEDVTKQGRMIHAWTYEKAQEYLTKLAQS